MSNSSTHTLVRHLVAVILLGTATVSTAIITAPQPAEAGVGETVDGRHAGEGMVPAHGTIEVDVSGRGGTSHHASVVAINVTITSPRHDGYATVYPCGEPRPQASTINYRAGQTIANGTFARVGDEGSLCIYTLAAAHIVADINGQILGSSQFKALTPARLLDTREGFPTIDGRAAGSGIRPAGSTLELDVAGRGGGIGTRPSAVAANVTVTGATAPGFATIYPCGEERPETSTLNYAAGQTVANAVLARVGDLGRVCIFTLAAADIVVDVSGAFTGTDDFAAVTPSRLADSRNGHTTVDGRAAGGGIRPAGSTLEFRAAGRGGSPANAVAVSVNVAVTQGSEPGFATVYPCGEIRPDSSTINFARGETVANSVMTKVGRNGKICIYTSGITHLVADLDGYAPSASEFQPLAPARLLDTRPATPATPPPPSVDQGTAVSLQLLNELRAAHGAGPVRLDTAISATATAWSAEMSRTGFRHSSAGFAENIAWHSLASMSPTQAATRLHQMWVDSPGHFRNMVDPRWTHVGIGLHADGSGWYGTHMFTN